MNARRPSRHGRVGGTERDGLVVASGSDRKALVQLRQGPRVVSAGAVGRV